MSSHIVQNPFVDISVRAERLILLAIPYAIRPTIMATQQGGSQSSVSPEGISAIVGIPDEPVQGISAIVGIPDNAVAMAGLRAELPARRADRRAARRERSNGGEE